MTEPTTNIATEKHRDDKNVVPVLRSEDDVVATVLEKHRLAFQELERR